MKVKKNSGFSSNCTALGLYTNRLMNGGFKIVVILHFKTIKITQNTKNNIYHAYIKYKTLLFSLYTCIYILVYFRQRRVSIIPITFIRILWQIGRFLQVFLFSCANENNLHEITDYCWKNFKPKPVDAFLFSQSLKCV